MNDKKYARLIRLLDDARGRCAICGKWTSHWMLIMQEDWPNSGNLFMANSVLLHGICRGCHRKFRGDPLAYLNLMRKPRSRIPA
jgi:hypothetical protein